MARCLSQLLFASAFVSARKVLAWALSAAARSFSLGSHLSGALQIRGELPSTYLLALPANELLKYVQRQPAISSSS